MLEFNGMKSRACWLVFLFVLSFIPALASQASAQPTFSKTFSPATIAEGSVSTLTFNIANADTEQVTDLAFSDTLPAGVSVADAPGISNTCGGTVSATAGGDLISLADGILSGSSSCKIVVYVTSSTAGTHTNTTGTLTSSAGDSGTATNDLIVNAEYPHFSKSFSPRSINKGGRTTLTFNIDTMGLSKGIWASNFTDTLPAALELAYPTNLYNDCPGSFTIGESLGAVSLTYTNNYTSLLPTMDVDETCSISLDFTANVPGLFTNLSGNFSGSLTNASYQIESFDSGKAASDVEVSLTPLSIWKDFPDDPVGPGDTTTLTFTIMNSNRATATNITFTDDLDGVLTDLVANDTPLTDPCGSGSSLTGTDTLVLNNGYLESAESCTFSVNLLIPSNAPVGGYLNTTTAVTADIDGSPVTGNVASEYLYIQPAPQLVKVFDPATAIAGDTVDIDFTITNISSTVTLSNISFTDEIASGLNPTSASAGDCTGATFMIVYDSGGDPTGLSFSGGSLGPNASCTASVTLNLSSLLASGVYDNTTSSISGTVSGSTYVGSPASDSLTVYGAPLLTKSFTDDPVSPGDPVTLEFTITNRDAVNPVSNISFTDDLDAALSGLAASSSTQNDICGLGSSISGTSLLTFSNGSLGAGESCNFSVTVDTPGGATSGSYPNTTSSITASTGGQAVTGGAATGDLMIGELSMTKEFTDDPALPGSTVNLRFVITNNSSSATFTDITFSDSLKDTLDGLAPSSTAPVTDTCNTGDQLTWTSGSTTGYLKFTGGTLAPAESCTIDVPVDIPAGAATGSYLNRTYSFEANIGATPYTFANTEDRLEIEADLLEITKTFTEDPLPPDGASTLEFTITNLDSTRTITDITFTDDLDAALSGLEATGLPVGDVCGVGSQISGTGLLTLTGGSLAAGADCTITVDIHVPSSAGGGTTAVNTTSEVTGLIGASAVRGPAATDSLTINDVAFTKTFGAPALQVGTTTLSFYIENKNSVGTLDLLTFSDDLDGTLSGLVATDTPISAVCGPDSSITGTSTLILNRGYLEPGDSCTFEVTVQTPFTGAAGNYTNTTSALFNNTTIVAEAASDTLTVQTRYYTISGTLTDSATSQPIPGATVSFSHDTSSVTTDSSGNYTKTVALGTNTTVTPSQTGYASWSPASQTFNSLDGDKTQNFSGTLETFTISGQVTDGTNAVEGVTLTFSHDSGTTQTDASGNYSYTVDYGTTTTVTPSKTGYESFSPSSSTVTSITGNETRNFTGTIITFTISGQVTDGTDPLEGVTLTFSHDSGTTQTDASGNYSYTVDYGTTTTVTPSKTGYASFTPSSATITDITGNETRNFAGTIQTFTISGQVTDGADPIPGVTLTFSHDSGTTQTDASGNYTYTVDYGTTTTVTPSKTGYASFSPSSSTITSIAANETRNFTGTIETFTISGQVTDGTNAIPDVTLTFSHDSGTTQTDASGNYTYTVDYGTTTTVTPSKTGWASFSPTSSTITDITGNETRNFTGTIETFTISGQVTDGTDPLEGVTLTFSHDSGTTQTDASGNYTYTVDYDTTTTVTPSKTGYASFTPSSATITNITGNETRNFSGSIQTFTITGQVTDGANPLQGATLTFSHDSGTTQTDASGNYSYTVDYGTTTTVTPSLTGYHNWSPPSATFSSITGNETQNFEGAIQTFTITGQVTHDSDPVEGATLTFSHDSGTTQSGATGNYSYTVDYGTTTTVTPSKTGYASWAPSDRTLTNVTSDQSGQDFIGTLEIHDLTVIKDGEGEGTVTSNPAGIDCGSICTASYDYGTTVTLTATPEPGDFFDGWSGGGCSGAGACQVLIEADQTVTATFNILPRADLAVAKETNTYSPGLGGHITFIVRVTNNGPEDATGVVVTDVLPTGITYESDNSGGSYNAATGVWTIGNLADGETVDLMINALYDTEAVVTNTAQITGSTTYDPNPDNDTAGVTIDAEADISDLSVWKLGVPKPAETGDNLVYFISVGNFGPAPAANVELTDVFSTDISGVQYRVAGSGAGYASWPGGNVLSLGTLDPLAFKTVWVRGQLAGAPADGVLTNTADVATSTPDPVTGNDTSADRIPVLNPAPRCDLSVVKSADKDTAVVGDTLVMTITGTNNGPDDAASVQVWDLLHHGLTYVSDDSGGTYDPRTGLWPVGGLTSGASATLNITTEVNAGGVITNTALIGGDDCLDPNPANNVSTLLVNGSAGPDLALWSKITGLSGSPSLDQMALANGDQFAFVVQFENNGATVVGGVQVRVSLPDGVAAVAAVAGTGCYDPSTNIWHVDDALACSTTLENQADTTRIGVGSTLTLTLEVTDAAAVGAGEVTAEIIEPPTDPDITNNSVTRALEPGDDFQVDLAVNVAVNTTRIDGTQTGVITVTVRNNGPDTASSVQVLNRMPTALTLVSSYPSQGTYRSDTGIWMVGNLAASAAATLELIVTPAANAEAATFSTEISGVAETELNTGNNGSQVDIKVQKTSGGGSDGGCFLDNLLCR